MTIPTLKSPDKAARDPEATRGRILDAALEVFARKSYHDASVDDIVHASNTSKGSVYFHFPNKQTIFLGLMDQFANLLERRIEGAISTETTAIGRVGAALGAFLETFGKYRPLAKIMLVQAVGLGTVFEEKRLQLHDRFARLIRVHLEEAIVAGEIQPVDLDLVSYAWMGAINEIAIRWVYTGQPEPERILNTLRPMLLRSVGVEPAQYAARDNPNGAGS